jgi:hypothetical protein
MHFVAESVTEDAEEFAAFCRAFIGSVRPGGYLVAAFVEGQDRYRIGTGPHWPGYPVDSVLVREVFAPHTVELEVSRSEADPTVVEVGSSGMVVLTARRADPVRWLGAFGPGAR